MAGFKGQAENTIDGKGRVPVPAKMRKSVSPNAKDTFVATRGEDQFVVLFPLDYWEQEIESKLARLNNFDPQDREFIRTLYRWADEVTMDSQGRIAIPKALAAFAELKPGSKARIIGAFDCIEVWDPEVNDRHEAQKETSYADLAKSVMAAPSNGALAA
ncbi:MAG: division/cell wall cluster transcriptional repressor MraZ [Rubricoccaceae bacterium]